MTPPKPLTVDEIQSMLENHAEFQYDEHEATWCFPDIQRLCSTALAALRALQGVYLSDKTPDYEYGQPDRQGRKPGAGQRWKTPKEIAKPFRQTGEGKGGRGDE